MVLSVDAVRAELQVLCRGQALASPQTALRFSDELRRHLVGDILADADAALAMVDSVRAAAGRLSEVDRQIVAAELNIGASHAYATLTARQESLAADLGCTAKTVRRRAEQALTALAVVIASVPTPAVGDVGSRNANSRVPESGSRSTETLRRFWRLTAASEIDVVCSEIPAAELPEYALPGDRNYLRYAKFADLDTLIFIRTRFAQLSPRTQVRDFAPSEHRDTAAAAMVVVGGPPWNATFREFLPQLPFHFEPHPLGEDDPLVVPILDNAVVAPRWTPTGDLVDDVAVFTRLTLVTGTTVFLLGGCLTAGVLGAARTFLHGDVAASNIGWVDDTVGGDDVVVVTEVRRVGGMTDAADLAATGPLLTLARPPGENFQVIVDNTRRR